MCRGFQEVNVAFGGTPASEGARDRWSHDHREDSTQPLDLQYGPAHALQLTPGGMLAGIAGSSSVMVNSLHGQGIRRLGRDLVVEAHCAAMA